MYKFFSKTVLKCAKIRTNCFIRFKVLDNQTLLLNIFWATLYSIMFHLVQYSKQVEPVEEFCCLATSLRIMEIVRRKSMLEVLKQTQHSIDWITFGETGNWDYRLRSDFTIPSWKHPDTQPATSLCSAETWPLTKAKQRFSVWKLHNTNGWEGSWIYRGKI